MSEPLYDVGRDGPFTDKIAGDILLRNTLPDLRWQLCQAAQHKDWEEYEVIRVKLNNRGMNIPPRLS